MRRPLVRLLLVALSFLNLPIVASAAELTYPLAICADEKGTIYLADRHLPGVWKLADGKLELLFEGSKKFRTPLNAVRCVALDRQGRLIAGDTSTREIYRFNAENKPEPLTKGGIGMPMAIAFDSKGDIYVADLEIHRIVKVPEAGGDPQVFAAIPAPRGLAMDPMDRLWAVSAVKTGKPQLFRIDPEGKIESAQQEPVFNLPHHVALDPQGNAYVADNYEVAIWKVTPEGKSEKWVQGAPLVRPVGACWQGDRLLVVDPHAKAVFSIAADGKLTPVQMSQ